MYAGDQIKLGIQKHGELSTIRLDKKSRQLAESSRWILLVTAPDYTPSRRRLGAQGGTECEFSMPGLEGERVTYY